MAAAFRTFITDEALADLESIFNYISTHSPQNARNVVGRLLDAVDSLDRMPSRHKIVGRSRQNNSPVHSMVVRPYIVYYRVDVQRSWVFVLTIRHGARKQPRRFP